MVADVENGEHMNLRDSVESCRTSPAHHDSSKCCGGYDESGRISDSWKTPQRILSYPIKPNGVGLANRFRKSPTGATFGVR
jgi:hypothetical protein